VVPPFVEHANFSRQRRRLLSLCRDTGSNAFEAIGIGQECCLTLEGVGILVPVNASLSWSLTVAIVRWRLVKHRMHKGMLDGLARCVEVERLKHLISNIVLCRG
jgi:hypothetical protein